MPHIYAKTDEEVAYGLAWATAEVDFKSMQENFLTVRGRLAEVKGKDGAIMDFLAAFVGANESVDKLYENSFSRCSLLIWLLRLSRTLSSTSANV